MIYGIGNDLIEIERVLKACEKENFIKRVYTEAESALIAMDKKKAAGNFAVKEAVVKVFGTGFGICKPKEIEVLRDEKGKPYVTLYGNAKKFADEKEIKTIHVSITNTKEYVCAVAIGELNTE